MLFACIVVIILAVVVFFVFTGKQPASKIEERVLEIANESELAKELVVGQGFDSRVTEISKEKISAFAVNDKLYEGLPEKELYKVDYFSSKKGSFVAIIDLEEAKVLKFYRVASISLGTGN